MALLQVHLDAPGAMDGRSLQMRALRALRVWDLGFWEVQPPSCPETVTKYKSEQQLSLEICFQPISWTAQTWHGHCVFP